MRLDMSTGQTHKRDNVISREDYDAGRRENRFARKRSPRGRPPINVDSQVAQYARSNPRVLQGWLERVEDRFMGSPVDITPEEALTQALRITAGEVRYCDEQIRRLSEDELFERPQKTMYAEMPSGGWEMVEERRDAETISRWQLLRRDAMDRMTRYAKMALDVGLEERNQRIRESQADVIAKFFEAVMGEIELTPDQQRMVGPALRRHLEIVETTAVEVP